jgi:GH24 family phage-related lysozyme (muramidase)
VPGILGAGLVGLVPTIITALGGAAVIFSAIAAGFIAYEGFKWLMNDPRDINGNPLTPEAKNRGDATVGVAGAASVRGVTGTASKLVGVAENAALKFATKPTGLPMTATRTVAGKAATALGTSGKALGIVSKIAKIGGSAFSGIGVGMDLYDAANTKNPTRRKLKYAAAALGGAGLAADLTGIGAVLGVPLQIAGGALSLYADYAQPESKDAQTPPEESTSPTRTSTGVASAQTLSTSDSVIDSLINTEGFSPIAVPDGDNMQIGYGDNYWDGRPTSLTNPGRTVTESEARDHARRRITEDFEPDVKNSLTRPVTQDQFDALIHLAYNSPRGAQKIIAKMNKGGAVNQADFMSATPMAPEYKAGLTTRRIHEFAMFNGRAGSPSSGQSAATPVSTSIPPATRSAAPLAGASANLAGLERSMNNFFMNTVQNSPAAAPMQSNYIPYRVNPRDDSRQAINTINAV